MLLPLPTGASLGSAPMGDTRGAEQFVNMMNVVVPAIFSFGVGSAETLFARSAEEVAPTVIENVVTGTPAIENASPALEDIAVHGNSLKSLRPTWGYKLYSKVDGTFLKNGITSKLIPETRYTQAFIKDKEMIEPILFPNRQAAYDWEYLQNTIQKGTLNRNMH